MSRFVSGLRGTGGPASQTAAFAHPVRPLPVVVASLPDRCSSPVLLVAVALRFAGRPWDHRPSVAGPVVLPCYSAVLPYSVPCSAVLPLAGLPSSVLPVCSDTVPSFLVLVARRPYRAASLVVQVASQVRPVQVGVPNGLRPILLFDSGQVHQVLAPVGSSAGLVAPTRVAAVHFEIVLEDLVPNLEGILAHPVPNPNLARNQPRRVESFVVNRGESFVDHLDREGNSVGRGQDRWSLGGTRGLRRVGTRRFDRDLCWVGQGQVVRVPFRVVLPSLVDLVRVPSQVLLVLVQRPEARLDRGRDQVVQTAAGCLQDPKTAVADRGKILVLRRVLRIVD